MKEKKNKRNKGSKEPIKISLAKGVLIFEIIVLLVIIIINSIIMIRNNREENKDYSLSEIVDEDLNNLYIRGRSPEADAMLNYTYGSHKYASSLSDGSTTHNGRIYYDKDGNVKLTLDFLDNENQVYVNGEKYIYSDENTTISYKTHELYPDPNNSEAESLVYNIVKLFENDDEYWWNDYDVAYNQEDYPQNFETGLYFYNKGVSMTVLEYNDNSVLDEDYKKEVERIKTWNGATISNEEENVTYLDGENKDFRFIVIKYNNLLISVNEVTNDSGSYTEEYTENINIVENYLKEQNII